MAGLISACLESEDRLLNLNWCAIAWACPSPPMRRIPVVAESNSATYGQGASMDDWSRALLSTSLRRAVALALGHTAYADDPNSGA